MKKIYVPVISTLMASFAHANTLPAPTWHEFQLNDGSKKELKLYGDQESFWYQDREGIIYVYDEDIGWFYGQHEVVDGRFVAMSIGVEAKLDAPQSVKALMKEKVSPTSSLAPSSRIDPLRDAYFEQTPLRAVNATDDPKHQPLLVVQVSFNDEAFVNDFTDVIFGDNQQSVKDYFHKNSYGRYIVEPARETQGTANDGVIDITLDIAHPNCHSKTDKTCDGKLRAAFKASYDKLDRYVDLSTYDDNNDDKISPDELSVMFVFAGYDKSAGSINTPYIWPHRFSHNTVEIDGKTIRDYCLFADFQGNHQSTMGVIAHELGHLMLGLPDLYSYKHSGSVGQWGLMGGGSWASKKGDKYAGATPVNMLAWSKEAAGFIKPKVIDTSGSAIIETAQGEGVIYLDPYLKKQGPRAYFENRRKNQYDRALSGEGLLITAVSVDNRFNDKGPMQVQIFQADGLDELQTNGWSDQGDVFPGSSKIVTVSDDTLPSLKMITGGRETNITINDIASTAQNGSLRASIPSSNNKSAWITSLSRTYAYEDSRNNTIGFGLDNNEGYKSLVGFYLYAKPILPNADMRYRMFKYDLTTNRWGDATINVDTQVEVSSGTIPESGGRVMFAAPFEIDDGEQLLVIELENAKPEYSYSFLDAYLSNGQKKKQFYGTTNAYKTNGLSEGRGRNYPFAALLEKPQAKPSITAQTDSVTLMSGESVTVDVLANDRSSDANNTIKLDKITTKPAIGSAEIVGQKIRYSVPVSDIPEQRTVLKYQVSDDFGTTAEGEVVITVNSPVVTAGNLQFRVLEDTPLILNLRQQQGLKKGDTIVVKAQPKHGKLDGDTYQSDENYFGNDQFEFTILKENGRESNTATAVITVEAVNDEPIFTVEASRKEGQANDKVTLSALDLKDVDSTGHSFKWRQVSGTTAKFTSTDSPSVDVTLPKVSKKSEKLTFEVAVNDKDGAIITKSVEVVVKQAVVVEADPGKSEEGGSMGLWITLCMMLISLRTKCNNMYRFVIRNDIL
ncbi:M6 family metalloprotease domain-containing protein [Vibrio harveyi]|uniref:M6 family metalloprotease domain-containing protein n=2 Tax=Vibrio harveyi TaxID=669 RepID=UPI00211A96FB|nr:M6 family metalloprotease domain-containing protein [Vibrio harveyi]EKO3834131.1 M6 family metalloprotease domain-containing protein [Vibrio harveyi]EKY4196968.1 M6 family metalloprotease domain-containing protein [Vibrio harveyi]MCQ9085602.1 M6 family metalloprotease domain-containing protein [Vibrio harveyi]